MNIRGTIASFPKKKDRIMGRRNVKENEKKGRRMVENKDERGLGRAYVISDSTFERVKRIPACCLWRDKVESTRLRQERRGTG